MPAILRGPATFGLALLLAGCGGTAATAAAPTIGPASQPNATQPTATEAAATGASTVCAESTDPTTVQATVSNFQWSPVSAKVGDVITWTNSDSAPHAVSLDDGSCSMSDNIAGNGGTGSLKFNVAGTFPFHCSVHPNMKGTITIS